MARAVGHASCLRSIPKSASPGMGAMCRRAAPQQLEPRNGAETEVPIATATTHARRRQDGEVCATQVGEAQQSPAGTIPVALSCHRPNTGRPTHPHPIQRERNLHRRAFFLKPCTRGQWARQDTTRGMAKVPTHKHTHTHVPVLGDSDPTTGQKLRTHSHPPWQSPGATTTFNSSPTPTRRRAPEPSRDGPACYGPRNRRRSNSPAAQRSSPLDLEWFAAAAKQSL